MVSPNIEKKVHLLPPCTSIISRLEAFNRKARLGVSDYLSMLAEQPLHDALIAVRRKPGKMSCLGNLRKTGMGTRFCQRIEHIKGIKRIYGRVFRSMIDP